MSVYCPNCGMSNEETSKFCMNCGTPLAQQSKPETPSYTEPPAQPVSYGDSYQQTPAEPYGGYQQQNSYPYAAPVQQQAPAQYVPQPVQKPKKKKGKTAAVIVVSLVALLLVAAVVLIVVLPLTAHVDVFGLHLFDNSPKQVTERMLKGAYVDFNAKEVVDCLYEAHYGADGNKVSDSDVRQLQSMLDMMKTQMTSANATINYAILDEYYVDDAKYNETVEKMKKEGTDTSKIEKMLEVDFKLESNGQKSDALTALCIKADGKWYVSGSTFTQTMSQL